MGFNFGFFCGGCFGWVVIHVLCLNFYPSIKVVYVCETKFVSVHPLAGIVGVWDFAYRLCQNLGFEPQESGKQPLRNSHPFKNVQQTNHIYFPVFCILDFFLHYLKKLSIKKITYKYIFLFVKLRLIFQSRALQTISQPVDVRLNGSAQTSLCVWTLPWLLFGCICF